MDIDDLEFAAIRDIIGQAAIGAAMRLFREISLQQHAGKNSDDIHVILCERLQPFMTELATVAFGNVDNLTNLLESHFFRLYLREKERRRKRTDFSNN